MPTRAKVLACCWLLSMLAGTQPGVAQQADSSRDHVSFHSVNSSGWVSRRSLQRAGIEGSRAARPMNAQAAATAEDHRTGSSYSAICTGSTASKQSCMFSDVCMQFGSTQGVIHIYLPNTALPSQVALLCRHIKALLADRLEIECSAQQSSDPDCSSLQKEQRTTALWRVGDNKESFGHGLVNEAFPMFLMLRNHFGQNIPTDLQALLVPGTHHVLEHILQGTVAPTVDLLQHRLAALQETSSRGGNNGICFRQLLVGDGGYEMASRASLSNSRKKQAHEYAVLPSFFDSYSWWMFREHAFQVAGVGPLNAGSAAAANIKHASGIAAALDPGSSKHLVREQLSTEQDRPLILLNDKRYGPTAASDRRMILNIDELAADIREQYPAADVRVARFRDMQWSEQLQLLSRAAVFITTQGSSGFRLVFLPKGSTCVMIGSPEEKGTDWTSFHELDRWFPLTYVQFARYPVLYDSKDEYEVKLLPGQYQPSIFSPRARRQWNLYNASIRVRMDRLKPLIDQALAAYQRRRQ